MVKTIFIVTRTEKVIAELNGVLYDGKKGGDFLYNRANWDIVDIRDKLIVHGVGMSYMERYVYVEEN